MQLPAVIENEGAEAVAVLQLHLEPLLADRGAAEELVGGVTGNYYFINLSWSAQGRLPLREIDQGSSPIDPAAPHLAKNRTIRPVHVYRFRRARGGHG